VRSSGQRGGPCSLVFDLAQMKVAFVAGNLSFGGAERQLFYLVRGLREAGAQAQVLCLTRGDVWEERLRALGASVTWVGHRASRAARLRDLIACLRRDRPAVLQSQHFYTNLYVVAAARLLRLREIGAVRNDGFTEVAFTGALGSLSLRAPRLIAANSHAGVRNAVALGVPAHRVRLLPNVIDTALFEAPPRPCVRSVRLLTIGMRPEKRLDRLLEILRRVRERAAVPVTAVIVGDNPERPRYERLARELGLAPTAVRFTGFLTDTAPAYREADVFVLTSEREGTPNVLLEAMAAGLPVVAYRTGGVPEVVQPAHTGYIAELGDEEAFIKYVVALAEHAELRKTFGERARCHVKANYCVSRLPTILRDFYEAALSCQ
jgi:glycosyltransferase involved in cell wall biosynthesis